MEIKHFWKNDMDFNAVLYSEHSGFFVETRIGSQVLAETIISIESEVEKFHEMVINKHFELQEQKEKELGQCDDPFLR